MRLEPFKLCVFTVLHSLEHLDPETLQLKRWGHPSDVKGTKLHFWPGDIIYGKRRAYQRKLAVADFEGICSAHAFVIRAKEEVVLPEFLPFFMQSELFHQRALQISVGSLSPTINWKTLAKQEFPLPSLDEQRRIAEILWAADKTVENYRAVLSGIKNLVKAIRVKRLVSMDLSSPLSTFCEKDGIQIGPFGSQLHEYDYVEEGVPVVMPANMTHEKIMIDGIAKITPEKARELEKHKLKEGDILLPRRGELDKRAIIEKEQAGWLCGTGSLRIRVKANISPKAIFHALSASPTVEWLKSNAVGTTMPNLNSKIIANIPIYLPSKAILDETIHSLDELAIKVEQFENHLAAIYKLRILLLDHYLL